jgi:precorrin-3B synthase
MAGVTRADRCPGVLRPHLAVDGAVVRIRVPGGQTTGVALGSLSRIAREFGSGDLQLTSRAGIQLRGLPDPLPTGFVAAVRDAGFLPSDTHELVRNIVASPLTGISGGLSDVRPLVVGLDVGLCAEPELADLPSRFLFAVDDGRGDVSRVPFDLGYRAAGPDHGWLMIGGPRLGIPVAAGIAVEMLLDLAQQFLQHRDRFGAVWHVRDLPSWANSRAGVRTINWPRPATKIPLGEIAGAASVQVPLALLAPAPAATVEACAGGPVVITPTRGLVLPGAADHLPDLVAAGLVDDAASPWSRISACVGAPSCRNSLINTRSYATSLARSGSPVPRTHISGCERRCGAPADDHLDLVAPMALDLPALPREA